MKKLILLMCILLLVLTGCKKPEPLDPVDPVPVDPTPVDPDPTPVDPEPTPVDTGLTLTEIWQYLARYDHFENAQTWDGFISFSEVSGDHQIRQGQLNGKKIRTGQLLSFEYNLDDIYEFDFNLSDGKTVSYLIRFKKEQPAQLELIQDDITYVLKASNSEIPADTGLDEDSLWASLSSFSGFESEDGFFCQFVDGEPKQYTEGMKNSGFMINGTVEAVEYKGDDVYNVTVFYEAIEEGVDNEGIEAHSEVIVISFDSEDHSSFTLQSGSEIHQMVGKYDFNLEEIWSALCSYQLFEALGKENEYVRFDIESGSCYFVMKRADSSEETSLMVEQFIPADNGFIVVAESEHGQQNYTFTYSLTDPENLKIQYSDELVSYRGKTKH